ncbi:hypothetical protein K9M59_02400 [Candidatus Gracilibacteria bacterium]|nr:hypothetical protein [Candidatus Gracilibacteria bacterium]MCF7819693.1 hypothetical protein [Candidatus Gracilibacteria bacterium]
MIAKEKDSSPFGFDMQDQHTKIREWDQDLLRQTKSLWGIQSVETSIQFSETHE